ncbi:MAG: glycosyltransferase family 2 protein [Gemmatimonadales bacterium]|nr:glycosyltransferase family 2 protein [Gemmatimonadales bacterium]
MTDTPRFSVVVPAHNAAAFLPETLGALAASEMPRTAWELIVVDDASTDGTAAVARRFADNVLSLDGGPGGPGKARNAGAAVARGDWLAFVDSDVRVKPETLGRFRDSIQRHPHIVAVFGTYDDRPAARGLVSEYRNLLHRFVHLEHAGEAATFWAGCGAVRRSAFEAAGGFDTDRYPRPSIEDIELGYRLGDLGGKIVLDPTIEATHLKRWTLWGIVKTDIGDRGIPWTRLLLERRGRTPRSLNTGGKEPAKVLLAGVAIGAAILALLAQKAALLAVAASATLILIVWNADVYLWFAQVRSVGFALAVVPLHLTHYACNVVAAASGVALYAQGRLRERFRKERMA